MSVKRMKPRSRGRKAAASKTDWTRLTRVDDQEIRNAVGSDPDTFMPDSAWWKRAQVVMPGSKEAVSLRIDAEVLNWFRRQGIGYQTRINAVLRSYVAAQRERKA